MDYAEAREAFFNPRVGNVEPLGFTSPARALRDAIEPIAAVCFWSQPSYDALAAHGMDFLQGYVWGRASVLGEPEPQVAAAAFGVFEPSLVADLYSAGRAACSLAELRAARIDGVSAARAACGDPTATPGLDDTIAALRDAAGASSVTGRPLFAGWTAQPWPADPWAQLWQACSLLRELRGDNHLAALVAAGLDGVQANVLTELWIGWDVTSYTGSRGWSPQAMRDALAELDERGLVADGSLSEDGRRVREQLEQVTDDAMRPVVDALGTGLDQLTERLAGWAQRIIDHGWFPPDPYKRAAG